MRNESDRDILRIGSMPNPFDVLGLDVGGIDDATVLDAVGRRMAQIASHPQSDTPAANDARLAVHAAAAQLLDSDIRAALLERAGVSMQRQRDSSTGPASAQVGGPRHPDAARLGPELLRIVAGEGGWNSRSLRRSTMIAHAQGIPSAQIPAIVHDVLGSSSTEPAPSPGRRQGRTPSRRVSSASDASPQWPIVGGLALIAIAALGGTWLLLSARLPQNDASASSEAYQSGTDAPAPKRSSSRDAPPSLESAGVSDDDDPAVVPRPDQRGVAAPEEPDWAAALLGVSLLDEPPEFDTLVQILDGLGESWTSLSDDAIGRAVGTFVDVVYRLPSDTAVGLVNRGSASMAGESVLVAAWYGGLINRLASERALPIPVDNAIVATMSRAGGPTPAAGGDLFLPGAGAVLAHAPKGWTAPVPAGTLADWSAGIHRLARSNPSLGQAAAGRALEHLSRSGIDPSGDLDAADVIETVAGALRPSEDRDSAAVVLGLLADDTIPASVVASAVNAVLRQGPASSSQGTLRLRSNATSTERAETRIALEQFWLGGSTFGGDVERLAAAIDDHLAMQSDPSGPAGWLEDAARSARLAAIAQQVLWGTASDIDALIASATRATAPRNRTRPASAGWPEASSAWAERYLAAGQRIGSREALLGDVLRSRQNLSLIGAELIVAEAFSGSPVQVRREAQTVVRRLARQPAIVNAVYEQLPTAPRVESVGELVERVSGDALPPIDSPEWPAASRRAVSARLLQLLAVRADDNRIEAAVAEYAEAIGGVLGTSPGASATPEALVDDLMRSRTVELSRLDRTGEGQATIDAIERSRVGRLALARGSVHRTVASQAAGIELLGAIVRAERPGSSPAVDAALTQMLSDKRGASSAFEQIAKAERASLRLWAIRLGVVP
ncbi:MAG: hypothetical protein AAFR96_08095 [Planctomycetota bacterium]